MSSFRPTEHYLQGFKTALNEKSCCEWFRKLKNGEIYIKYTDALTYDLTPRDFERQFCTSEVLVARHTRNDFLHRIVTDDAKRIN